jgi:hypothetical protein
MVLASPPILSNATLNADAEDRAKERAERKENGNIHGRAKKDLGRNFDELMASVFIERPMINSAGAMKPMYYCLGCDHAVCNGTRGRNTSHMVGCKVFNYLFYPKF